MIDWKRKFCQPSRLDNYAQYLTGNLHNYQDKDGCLPEYTEELFIDSLLVFRETEAMKVGTALHRALEISEYSALPDKFAIDGYTVEVKTNIQLEIPQLREMWVSREYEGLCIRGIVDAMSAKTIHDYKFTSKIDIEKYMNSWQWRVYLWMCPEHDNFVYDLFKIKIIYKKELEYINNGSTFDPEVGEVITDEVKKVEIIAYEKLGLSRYAGLEQDVQDMYASYFHTLEALKVRICDRAKELGVEV